MKRFVWALVISSTAAWADIPPSDTRDCGSKTAGAACTRDDGSAGVCRAETCSKNDYSEGVPPKRKNYPCLRCGFGDAPPTAPAAPAEPPTAAPAAPPTGGPAAEKKCNVSPELLTPLSLLALALSSRRSRI